MSLNPIQFGKDVIDQYGRYLLTTFRLADPHLAAQLREGLAYRPGTAERLAKGPFVFLNRPFVQGPPIADLIAETDLNLHPALQGLFPFESLHKHQEESLRAAKAERHVLMATGTGSGKTEGFLLPILDYCLKLRDAGDEPGLAAVLIYPMNALVNDQLERLRRLLAGSRLTFGRYTGETPQKAEGVQRLEQPRPYTKRELELADERIEELPLPWEECASRDEIRERRPRLVLTNYAQLEYLLLRDRDLELFRGAPLRFFVLDEIHTYTGARGSEVACLLRRLRTVAGRSPSEIVCIGSSATIRDSDGGASVDEALRKFASRLFGVPEDSLDLVKETFQGVRPGAGERYVPPPPEEPAALLNEILAAVREALIADEITELPEDVLALAGRLCGRPAHAEGLSLDRLFGLLAPNRVVKILQESFTQPARLEEVLPRLQSLPDREDLSAEALQAEILAYLTLGALARRDDEPLLRPKLHYFIQGLHGLWISWQASAPDAEPSLRFARGDDGETISFPLWLCRACGQHFVLSAASERQAVDAGGGTHGVRLLQGIAARSELEDAEGELLYFTNRLLTREGDDPPGETRHLCRHCGALHDSAGVQCLHPKCKRHAPLVEVLLFPHPVNACPACSAKSTERSPTITPVRSTEVYDVMILAQTELASMPEPDLRKVLIFADSRQDAAFQAGWMESRSLRFRVRHLVFQILSQDPGRWWYFGSLVDALVDRATGEGLVPLRGRRREPAITRLRWLLVEEFFAATRRQRRNSLEQLGLAALRYEGTSAKDLDDFAVRWAAELATSPDDVAHVTRLILDVLRLRHAVSDPLLGRWWSDRDREVREGVIDVPEYFRPQLALPKSTTDRKKSPFVVGFRSGRGATAVERLAAKAFPGVSADKRTEFLKELWAWLVRQGLLIPRHLKVKRYGLLEDLAGAGGGFQINLDLIQVAHADTRYVCNQCGIASAASPASGSCPVYNCPGTLDRQPRDEDHYDVVQYTRFEFVPLLSREHSAQVPREDRQRAEAAFKKTGGAINCLVATPTLELGVDIGPLEMVLMRNVPPSPANYAQRSGRAGRRHRIGVIFTYCRDVQHDQYFYREPPAMISGEVRIPSISLRNEPLIRKHVRSALLAALREVPDPEGILRGAFPAYIWLYFGEKGGGKGARRRFRRERPDFAAFGGLIRQHEDHLQARLQDTFTNQWPEADRSVVSEAALREVAAHTPEELDEFVGDLLAEISSYQSVLAEYRKAQEAGEILSPEEARRRDNYERVLQRLWREDQDNYSLTYLSRRGFFPGYALVKDAVRAQALEPPVDLSRPLPIAIRELTPASRLYANRQQFKVRRFDFYKLKAGQPSFDPSQLEQAMVYDPAMDRVLTTADGMEGGDEPGVGFTSLQLIDVELEGLGRISDQQEYRFRVGYRQYASLMAEHLGGHGGTVGTVPYGLLREARLRLVNLGPRRSGPASPGIGFPICTVCGETRSPFASSAEIEHFQKRHQKICGREIEWHALHVDVTSDLLRFGPFAQDQAAINLLESARIGSRRVLEMGEQELEIEILKDDGGHNVAALYDPMPGGSGLLPLLMEHWESVVEAARDVLLRCDCEDACYRCLLHYRNQQHHAAFNRQIALNALSAAHGPFNQTFEIPPNFVERDPETDKTDSGKEDQFLKILRARSFPLPPETQYKVSLGGGSTTVPDFAYPAKRVLIYIDGLSTRIHGNEEQRRKDRRLRTKAKLAGWHVCAFSAEGLSDRTLLADYLDELATLLGLESE